MALLAAEPRAVRCSNARSGYVGGLTLAFYAEPFFCRTGVSIIIMQPTARLSAALIAATAVAALLAQGIVTSQLPQMSGTLQVIVVLTGYFTILTNLIFACSFARVAITGNRGSALWNGGLVLWIGTVGLVYHLLLAGIWAPQGFAWWADQGLHTATPLLGLFWWLRFAPKGPLRATAPLWWTILPLAYCIYALLRGQITGFYAYPFIDAGQLGPLRTAINILGLTAGFVAGGYGVLFAARQLDRGSPQG